MKKFLRTFYIIAILTILCFPITGCADETETRIVKAKVTKKEYTESYTDFGYYFDAWKGKYRWKFKTFPEKYDVTVTYNDISKTFDDKNFYESVEIGDTVDMKLTTYLNLDGEIQSQYLSIQH